MKTILVPTQNIPTMRSTLETAVLLAQRTGAYIEGIPLWFGAPEFVVAELASGFSMEVYRARREEETESARKLFEIFMQEQDIPAKAAGDRPWSNWVDAVSPGESLVGSHGRTFDVTVMSRPDDDTVASYSRAIESALFESGRPVLIAPPSSPRSLATNVLIAWNQSTEQARTMADAMPFLRTAERITILTVEGATVAGPNGEQMARSLAMNGIKAETMTLKPVGKRSAGETILAKADELGCDLIIKGAYTQSRLRQMIFGGTTRHILANAKLPVLMAH